MRTIRPCAVCLGLVLLFAACGGAHPGSGFVSGEQGSTAGSSGGDRAPSLGDGDSGAGAACATSSSAAQNVPVYLVFMFDRSGSMKFEYPYTKWDACLGGIETFFADPRSSGLYASLQVFPYTSNECSTQTYQTPLVAMTALPDTAGAFGDALDASEPREEYRTPTLPAVKGAIAYAQSVKATLQNGEKVAVVLVTDGEPNDCSSTADAVGAEAAKTASTIPMYVIGVGSQLQSLDKIARGGGTSAILVDTSNPSQVSQDFIGAVSQVRNQVSCDYKLPAPPPGQTLDINSVNVAYTPDGGGAQTLTYDKDCAGGDGWHYDDPNKPQRIEMCAGSCSALKQRGGKVDIVLGCATLGGVAK